MSYLIKTKDGSSSMSKTWTNIAYATATYVVIKTAATITAEVLGVYLAIVSGSEVAKRWLEYRYGKGASNETSTSGSDFIPSKPVLPSGGPHSGESDK